MGDPFVGEIRMWSFDWAPQGWAKCDGAIMQIYQYQALFALIGNTYGGTYPNNFALPDLRGRVPIHTGTIDGQLFKQGAYGGAESVTLDIGELSTHNHKLYAYDGASSTKINPGDALLAATNAGAPIYSSPENLIPINPGTVSYEGGGQAHTNMQPYLTVNFCIALTGLFPSRQ